MSRILWPLMMASALAACGPPRGPDARHVVLISLDTTRADHLGCYGNSWIRTPNIDALAGESVLLTDFLTAANTTLASHTSLFTGKYPHSHGVPRNGFMVNAQNVMLPELLQEAGFHTAGFLGSFALERRFDFDQGFDHYDQSFDVLVGQGRSDQNQRSAARVTDAVIAYLEAMEVPERLFLFVHYFDPHPPYSPPPPYDRMYDEDSVPVDEHPSWGRGEPPAWQKPHLFGYAGEVSYMDEHVGRLLDFLRERGILDDAVLLLTSDHGENLGDAPGGKAFNHGLTVYEPEVRGVGVIRLPNGRHGGQRIDGLVGNVDILPTLADYLGLAPPEGIDGAPFDLERRESPTAGPRYAEATQPWEKVETDPVWLNATKARCVRQGKLKYVRTRYRGQEELFDLYLDPHEQRDLLARPGATDPSADDLRKLLAGWAASAHPLPSQFEQEQHDETLRRLRALGYLEE